MIFHKTVLSRLARLTKNRFPGLYNSFRYSSGCEDPCPTKKYMDVACKIALLTGSRTGIGLNMADAFLSCGLRKAIISDVANPEEGKKAVQYLENKHGRGVAEYRVLDVTNHKQFEDVYKEVLHKEGSLDILVNNAGILHDSLWELTIDVNVKGVMKGILLAEELMSKKGGCVLNTASIVGFDVFPHAAVYNLSKHAVVGITKSYDENYTRRTGVRVVAVCPGVTHTNLVHGSDKMAHDELLKWPKQPPESVGKGAVFAVEYGPPGSLWSVENSILSRVSPPHREKYMKKAMDL